MATVRKMPPVRPQDHFATKEDIAKLELKIGQSENRMEAKISQLEIKIRQLENRMEAKISQIELKIAELRSEFKSDLMKTAMWIIGAIIGSQSILLAVIKLF